MLSYLSFGPINNLIAPKVVAASSLAGVILAQEIPTQFEWAKLPLEIACVGALFWVVTRTMPSLFEKQITAQQAQAQEYQKDLTHILENQKAAFEGLSSAITSKVEVMTSVIKEVNSKQK